MSETRLELNFEYRIRESLRAKQLQLRITERYGLEVIVPRRLKNKVNISDLLNEKRNWIQKHLKTREQLINSAPPQTFAFPQEIALKSRGEYWSIHYLSHKRWDLLENPSRQLTLLGDITNKKRCHALLIQWLKNRAKIHLENLLYQLSKETNLSFRSCQIRGQKTRWGSCSPDKDISLNYQLLFLPPELVKHILLHELVHTKHMNHGIRFWKLLTLFDPNTHQNARLAKRAANYVPRWVYGPEN